MEDEMAEESLTVADLTQGYVMQGLVRTFFVFLDAPSHIEFRAHDMPVIPEGTELDFSLRLLHPKDPRRIRLVNGPYRVVRRKLVYSTERPSRKGLSQYLEFSPTVPKARSV